MLFPPVPHTYVTTPSGQKFGKSAGNAVALDEKVTSVFDFYQVCFFFVGVCPSKDVKVFVVLVEDARLACWAIPTDVYAHTSQ